MHLEEALKIVRDQMVELGATDSDADSVVESALIAVKEGRGKRDQALPIPKELQKAKAKEKWCEENGGHTISGFCESWSCRRCGLSGWD